MRLVRTRIGHCDDQYSVRPGKRIFCEKWTRTTVDRAFDVALVSGSTSTEGDEGVHMSEMRAAVSMLMVAGLTVGREWNGHLVGVDRAERRVWLDTGSTVRLVADKSDSGDELLLDAIEILDGPELRAHAEAIIAWQATSERRP